MRASADKRVVLVVELEEVRADVTQGDHSLNLGRLNLHIHSPLGETRDVAVELVSDFVLHELDELVLDACAFCLGGDHLTLGGVLAGRLVSFAVGALPAGEIGDVKWV